ncbi:TraI/MobA(P) family conjugative relaxase [Burkholderia sp. LMG 13014]|uniref:TraI/MobA(P) family conjugative relaxase n=1 Tax=Burkholderia sp. LMG 13014 TaxID=2709306 RepID=UPI001962917C|nr:TraI/MobA(P) family conjugative relaxase [Burkholderia sp. LMG 13014]
MIVKIAKGRRDGKSDLKQLTKYITSGIGVEVQKLAGFGELTTYVAKQTNDDGEHKCTAVLLQHLTSLDTAAAELYAVAAKNSRVADPVLHMIVSWPEHERPDNEAMFAAARRLLKAIHLDEHQAVMAIHNDTDNIHVHIEVNRVHPVTFKSQPLPWLHKTLHREARHIEIDNNWHHDNGLFIVQQTADGQKFVVPNDGYIEPDDLEHGTPTGAQMQLEAWSDEPSLVEFCRDVVTGHATGALDLEPSWNTLHDVLAQHSMRLTKTGASSWQLEAIQESGEIIRLPASRALRKLGLKNLAPKLGDFTPSPEPLAYRPPAKPKDSAGPERAVNQRARSTKRDPERREIRRLERAAARTALIERYRADKEAARKARNSTRDQQQQIRLRRHNQLEAHKAKFTVRRAGIQKDATLSATVKKQRYSLLAMERMQERLAIDASYATELDAVQGAATSIPVWRKWVEEQARLGDQAAISALRGMVYQERREEKKASRAQASDDDDDIEAVMRRILDHEKQEDSIRPASRMIYRPYHADVLLSVIRGVKWSVTNNGNISYKRERGDALFTDRGNKITFDRRSVTDEELQLALLHSRQKWGNDIVLTGTDEVFRARMVKAAVELGMNVKNPELRDLQTKYQAELAERLAGPRPDGDTLEHARAELVKAIARKDPAAEILTASANQIFKGTVAFSNSHWIAQQQPSGSYVLHERHQLQGRGIKQGADLTITYKGERGTARTAGSAEKRRGGGATSGGGRSKK